MLRIFKFQPILALIHTNYFNMFYEINYTNFGDCFAGCGSPGWQAPEQLSHGRQTTVGDMFILGCVLFFSITGGKHPFGDCLKREINIVKNKGDLSLVEFIP